MSNLRQNHSTIAPKQAFLIHTLFLWVSIELLSQVLRHKVLWYTVLISVVFGVFEMGIVLFNRLEKTGSKHPNKNNRSRAPRTLTTMTALFGVVTIFCVIAICGWLQRDLSLRSNWAYIHDHGKSATATIAAVVPQDYGCGRGQICTRYYVYYSFSDKSGKEYAGHTIYDSYKKSHNRTTLEVYYLPSDPTQQTSADNVPSIVDTIFGPIVFAALALFFGSLTWRTWRRLQKTLLSMRKIMVK